MLDNQMEAGHSICNLGKLELCHYAYWATFLWKNSLKMAGCYLLFSTYSSLQGPYYSRHVWRVHQMFTLIYSLQVLDFYLYPK
ncbi:hypothetical protein R1flu_028515 [Riccia fluitans]|uniref:Uncharacterized protein n=1 Tax=Riccia fluitans TaxID=41844 RepID=A0ABD1XLZ3_9MARC